jgi:hypothetical protein
MNNLVFIISVIFGYLITDIIYKFIRAYSDKRTKNEVYQRGLKDGIKQGILSRDHAYKQFTDVTFSENKYDGILHCTLMWHTDRKPYE